METVGKLYRGFLYAMAGIAGVMLVWLMISVIMSVVMRNSGLQPFAWLFTSSEYAILGNITRNDLDVRAYYFPKWILTIAFPVSFGLMAIEFSRFVFGDDLMHSGEAGIHE